MNELQRYISRQLSKALREHHVVVFYDPRREFEDYIEELTPLEPVEGRGGLPRYWVEDLQTHLARYGGSFFAVRQTVEPLAKMITPEALLIYLPGAQRDRQSSVLMELEKAGTCYEPQLRRLARNVLRESHTDGEIDKILASESLTYQDLASLLKQSAGTSSLLKVVLGEGTSEMLITRWLASPPADSKIEAKQAIGELFSLLEARLGLSLSREASLVNARHQVFRFLLVNEFRDDLRTDPPKELQVVPEVASKEQQHRVGEVLELLKRDYANAYIEAADSVEAELRLRDLNLEPAAFGRVDTFRFEEQRLLVYAAEEVAAAHYARALELVTERGASFWVDRNLDEARWAQWELCRLATELGRKVEQILPEVEQAGEDPSRWIEAYSQPQGWAVADRIQRMLESWSARMQDEIEEPLEKAVGSVRREHERLLEEMANGYSLALKSAAWTVPSVLHQTEVVPKIVEAVRARTAYFLVDALRFEMGQELTDLLADTEDAQLQPALTVLPSITPLGMAALLPEASATFSVVESDGKLAARIDQSEMVNLADRRRFLAARRPGSRDVDMGSLLQKSTKSLREKLSEVELLVVRSQSIDALGEIDAGHLARQIMDTVVGNVARAIRKLARVGFERFVVAADHGFQFSLRKGEDMLLEKPGGETIELHRRCWAGRGGKASPAAVRVSGKQLGYDTDLDFIFPRGLAVFKAGGSLAYHHGGISLQEMVVPILSLRIPAKAIEEETETPVRIFGYPDVITNRTFGLQLQIEKDLFTTEVVPVRLLLVAEGQEVGKAGMAIDVELDRATGTINVPPGKPVSLAMIVTREEFSPVRVVAQDPKTDAILAQTEDLPLKLGL